MIKIENVALPSADQWEAIIRGMRNPKNSWGLSDSWAGCDDGSQSCDCCYEFCNEPSYKIGPNDHKLMIGLAKGGPVHAKYRRMIPVFLDITAPLYWWKEFDTYKVGTVANSCSTMHKIQAKEFTIDDFSTEHYTDKHFFQKIVNQLEKERLNYNNCPDKKFWWNMIQLLPTSYNQKRTVMLNYEVLHNIYHSRKNHKLDEWYVFCDWIKSLPYSEIITTKPRLLVEDLAEEDIREIVGKYLKENYEDLYELWCEQEDSENAQKEIQIGRRNFY